MYNLGVLYVEGRGVVRDAVEVCVCVYACVRFAYAMFHMYVCVAMLDV